MNMKLSLKSIILNIKVGLLSKNDNIKPSFFINHIEEKYMLLPVAQKIIIKYGAK